MDLGGQCWLEPFLDVAPDGGKEGRCTENEDLINRLGVVCGGHGARLLQVIAELPEMLHTDAAQVDDVNGAWHGLVGVHLGTKRLHKLRRILGWEKNT